MKQILLLLSLFFAVTVNAQKKIIVVGGGIDSVTILAGQGLSKSGDSIHLGGTYAENILIHSADGKEFRVRSGEQVDTISQLRISKYGAYIESARDAGANSSYIDVAYDAGIILYADNSVENYSVILKSDDGLSVGNNDYTYYLPHPEADIEDKIMVGNSSNRLEFQPISSFLTPNFPANNDTITSGTPRIYLSGTGKVEIGGAFVNMSIAGDEIKFTSTLVENTITTTDQSFRTGSATENGRLYITSNYAQISARNAGGVTSNFTAFRNYAQIASADSLKITGLQEKAIDTLDYQLVIDANNRVHKVKRQVLKSDSTITITDSTITVNRSAVLGYKEIEGIIKSDGSFILLRSDLGGDWEVIGEHGLGLDFFGIYAKDSVEVTDTYLDFDPEKTTVYVSNNITHDGSNVHSYVSKVSSAIVPSDTPGYIQIFYYKDFDAGAVQPFVANAQADMSILIRIYE